MGGHCPAQLHQMAPKIGFKHSEESRKKMSESRVGVRQSEETKAKISATKKGKASGKRYSKSCVCGQIFTGSATSKYCCVECKRAQYGHGIRHSPAFRGFAQKCAICDSTSNLVGDHDHTTGKARGILCRNCNIALGNMRDNPVLLRLAANYLENTK